MYGVFDQSHPLYVILLEWGPSEGEWGKERGAMSHHILRVVV